MAEYGRQPWLIEGILPTFLGVSALKASQVWITIAGFTAFYGSLAVVEVMLMLHLIRKGPYAKSEDRTDERPQDVDPSWVPAE